MSQAPADQREPQTRWRDIATALEPCGQAFIAGEFTETSSGRTVTKRSAVDGRPLAEVADGRAEDVDRAVRAARVAFESGVWSQAPPRERVRVLRRFADALAHAREELAVLDTLEMGKPVGDALAEVDRAVDVIDFYAGAVDKHYGETVPTGAHAVGLVLREPVGVVGAVTPWNYPVTMPAWKLGPALAVGNSVVLKPAEQAPLCALRMAELARDAGLPEGVLNVVPGPGESAGRAVGLHPDVDAVTFTGSTAVGKRFLRYSAESNMKPVWLECGGKSANIVLADAPDLPFAATTAAEAIFANAGQSCNAGSRLVVEDSVHDRMIELLIDAARAWMPRDPLDRNTMMGAIVDAEQAERVLSYIDDGIATGSRVCLGGRRTLERTGGHYIEPTIFAVEGDAARLAREEVFGPVLSVTPVRQVQDAVRIANDSPYGLAAAIWTADVRRAHSVAKALRVGNVYVNSYDRSELSMPFGGHKQSGIGVDKSLHALDNYTRLKSVWIDLADRT